MILTIWSKRIKTFFFPCRQWEFYHIIGTIPIIFAILDMVDKIMWTNMDTIRIFQQQECIPVGCVPSAAAAVSRGWGVPGPEGCTWSQGGGDVPGPGGPLPGTPPCEQND